MNRKMIQCREHGGTFTIEARRGRPPVRCTDENPCSGVNVNGGRKPKIGKQTSQVEQIARATKDKFSEMNAAQLRAYAREISASTITKITEAPDLRTALRKYEASHAVAERTAQTFQGKLPEPRKAVDARSIANPCTAMAYKAREDLEPLGWVTSARGWTDPESGDAFAQLTATRGTELITLVWQNGTLTDQNYILWNQDVPKTNGIPERTKLGFDPDEMSDKELIQRLSGMKVSWWNRLGQSVETAIIPTKVNIEHAYSGTGDETPGDRVIKFVDMAGSGFRNFHVAALMKVG